MTTEKTIHFDVRKTDDGKSWVCSFTLYEQEYDFKGDPPSDAVTKATEFIKFKGHSIVQVDIIR